MSKEATVLEQKLKKMLKSKKHRDLDEYKDPKNWPRMSSGERELLGKLFIMQGKELLKKGDKAALKSFDLAVRAAPKSPTIFFQKGLAYSKQDQSVRCLSSACKAFEKATRLKPEFYDAWCQWAHTLLLVGEIKLDQEVFIEADKKFEVAEKYYPQKSRRSRSAFYWRWGQCWHMLAKLSGEAVDMSKALEKYKLAEEAGIDIAEFWNDYGNALGEQATLLGMDNLFVEVVDKFRKALQLDTKDFESWFGLACSYMRIYETTYDDEELSLASEAFECAAELSKTNSMLWLCYGQLYLITGKLKRNEDYLFEAAMKFEEANRCEANHPVILCRWAESLMCLGGLLEDIQFIHQAEEKITQSLKNDTSNAETWYFYGRVLVERGRYFSDTKYYLEAIEKYQYGFSLNTSLKLFHHGIAIAFFEIFELTADEEALKQALRHFHELSQEMSDLPAHFWVDWGNALFKYGELTRQEHYVEAALNKYEEAIYLMGDDMKKDPLIVSCVYHYGCALDTLGDIYDDPAFYEKAIQLLSHVVQYDKGFAHARYNLALAFAHLGELVTDMEILKKACEHFEVVLSEDPEDENGWNDWGVTLINLASLVKDPCRPDYTDQLYVEAESKLHQAIALGNIHAYYNLAGYYSLVGDYQSSLACLQKSYQTQTLPSYEELMDDEWLEPVRQTEEFHKFLSQITH